MPPAPTPLLIALTRVTREVTQIAQIRVFKHDILVSVLMHECFLVTRVHKQSRYDFEEFTLAQFAHLPGGEAALKKLDPGVTRTVETWSLVLEGSRKFKSPDFNVVLFCAVEPMDLAFWGFRLARQFCPGVDDNGESRLIRASRL